MRNPVIWIEWLLSTLFDASLLELEPQATAAHFLRKPRPGARLFCFYRMESAVFRAVTGCVTRPWPGMAQIRLAHLLIREAKHVLP